MHSGIFRARQVFVFLFFLLSLTLLLLRLFFLQALQHRFYFKIANEEHIVSVELQAKRGTIFDRNMRPLAVNLSRDSIYANPREIKDKAKTARIISVLLSLKEDSVTEKLSKNKGSVAYIDMRNS